MLHWVETVCLFKFNWFLSGTVQLLNSSDYLHCNNACDKRFTSKIQKGSSFNWFKSETFRLLELSTIACKKRVASKRRGLLTELYQRQSNSSDYPQFVKACDVRFASKRWGLFIVFFLRPFKSSDYLQFVKACDQSLC